MKTQIPLLKHYENCTVIFTENEAPHYKPEKLVKHELTEMFCKRINNRIHVFDESFQLLYRKDLNGSKFEVFKGDEITSIDWLKRKNTAYTGLTTSEMRTKLKKEVKNG